jgi:ABC-type branched-subunit amino acid transport system substrate-binding protein
MMPTPGIFKNKFGLLAIIFPVLFLLSCASTPKTTEQIIQEDYALAGRLYASVQTEYSSGQFSATINTANELIDRHSTFPKLDHVYKIATDAALARRDNQLALKYIFDFNSRFQKSEYRDYIVATQAAILVKIGRDNEAAAILVELYESASSSTSKQQAVSSLATIVNVLSADQLGAIRENCGDKGLGPYLGYLEIQSLLDERRPRKAAEVYSTLKKSDPENEWLAMADKLLSDPAYVYPAESDEPHITDGIDATRIVVLCPSTGKYTVLGNAFYDGAKLAKQSAEDKGWRQYILSTHDTGGDPVLAALATRELLTVEKPIAVIGGLLSASTTSIAIVADQYGIPVISPTATNDRINEIGPMVFQPNLTGMFESRLLARVAIDVLLKQKVAVLYPDNPEGLRRYQAFADEVVDLGGEVVASVSYGANVTDFRDEMDELSEKMPQVIFVPASVDEMMMIGPQLDFYRTGTLVLGPSEWNSVKLAAAVGNMLERALFPSDTALYPPEWITDFEKNWDRGDLPMEATIVARKAYLSTMLVMDSLGEGGFSRPSDLALDLESRLTNRLDQEMDAQTMESSLRMFLGGEIVNFPIDRYDGAFAVADSLSDSLTVQPDSLETIIIQ